MGPTAASGGMLKQMGSLNETGTGDEQVMATLVQTMANNKRGSLVSLSIPVVDYGYSGTVSNAVLEVPGEGKDTFTAVHTAPDENGMYTPNGTVTITEYSPHMLRGTFSGSLVKVEDMHKASSENPVLPVSETISGQFAVAAPWRGNAAPSARNADSALMTGAREDMMDFLLKIPEDMRSSMITGEQVQNLCQLGFEDQQLANLGISGGCTGSGAGSASVQQCDCSCEAWVPMKEIPLCQSQCSTHWETEQCEVSIAEENRQRDEEYERYRRELLALNLDEDTADTQLHAFRNAPQGLREKLWNDLEIIRQELAQMGASDVQQAKEMNKPVQNWDAETLSYKAALEAAGKSEVEINGLATLFSISDETVRQVLWDDLQQ